MTVESSLIVCIVTGFIYSSFLLYLLSHFADKVAWICLLVLQISFCGSAYFLFVIYGNTKNAISGNANSERVFGGSEV